MKNKTILPLIGFIALAGLIYYLTLENKRYQRTDVDFQVPAVTLLNQHNQPVPLRDYLSTDMPIMLEFIFTSCTTLCPNQSVKFSNFQKNWPRTMNRSDLFPLPWTRKPIPPKSCFTTCSNIRLGPVGTF